MAQICWAVVLFFSISHWCSAPAFSAENYPVARFTDPQRLEKLAAAFPEVDRHMERFATSRGVPGMVWGVVIDGKLAHFGAYGVRDLAKNDPVNAQTVFRIASMTKSFTAMAILKLREEGRLSLEDPVSRWIPEFSAMPRPSTDSGPIRVRHLLIHAAGFPEDNPWGDQQLGAPDAELTRWLEQGIPFSTVTGSRYEYSNYAFGLLGRIIARASGKTYAQYLESSILAPLGMTSSTLEAGKAPAARRATGYRRKRGGAAGEEPPLAHGAFGAMGGLWTSAEDLAKYIAFHLSAWPARDEAEGGPVRRATLREMNAPAWFGSFSVSSQEGKAQGRVSSYGFGLNVSADCRFDHIVSHGGGLPGFGSHMAWLPEYGIGMFAMDNLTYAGQSQAITEAWDIFLRTGGLLKRELPPSAQLLEARDRIFEFWKSGDMQILRRAAAMNLFLDVPEDERRAAVDEVKSQVGVCREAGPVRPEDWMRGQFNVTCESATVGVFFTLAPTQPPGIQHLSFRKIEPAATMTAPTSSAPGVRCAP